MNSSVKFANVVYFGFQAQHALHGSACPCIHSDLCQLACVDKLEDHVSFKLMGQQLTFNL